MHAANPVASEDLDSYAQFLFLCLCLMSYVLCLMSYVFVLCLMSYVFAKEIIAHRNKDLEQYILAHLPGLDLSNIDPQALLNLLLYGSPKFKVTENRIVLEASIAYIKATNRLN